MNKMRKIGLIFALLFGFLAVNGQYVGYTVKGTVSVTADSLLIINGDTIGHFYSLGTDTIVDKKYIDDLLLDTYVEITDSTVVFITPAQLRDSMVALPGGHDAVTLAGSATNGGLSLTDQEVGFREANSSQSGYMSSATFNIFNNKLSYVSHDTTLSGNGTTASPLSADTSVVALREWVLDQSYITNLYLDYDSLSNTPTIPEISNVAYGASWDDNLDGASKNAIYDAIQILGGGGATNLTYSATPDSGVVNSDTGTDATIPAGSTVNASLMLPVDKVFLDTVDDSLTAQRTDIDTNIAAIDVLQDTAVAHNTRILELGSIDLSGIRDTLAFHADSLTLAFDSLAIYRTDINALPTFVEMRGEISDSIAGIGGADLWTAGTSGRIYYDGGNVGIGTSSPDNKLVVSDSISGYTMLIEQKKENSSGLLIDINTSSNIYKGLSIQRNGTELFGVLGNSALILKEIDTSTTGFIYTTSGKIYYQSSGNTYDLTEGGTGSGASNFLELTDSPSSYSSQAGKYVRVNSSANGLEFATGTSGSSLWDETTYGIKYSDGNVGIKTDPSSSIGLYLNNSWSGAAFAAYNTNTSGRAAIISGNSTSISYPILQIDKGSTTQLSFIGDGSFYQRTFSGTLGTVPSNFGQWYVSGGKPYFRYGTTSYDLTAAGAGGEISEVSSATTNQLTVANGTTTPALSIVTGAVANGGTSLPTGDQVYDFVMGTGFLTGNQSITLSGDVTGSGTTAITTTIGSGAVEASMLNNNIISGKTELASGLASTDELMISDAGTVKRMDVSVIQSYMQDNLTFGGGGEVTQLTDLSDVSTATPTTKHALIGNGTTFASRALVEADISDLGTYLESETDPVYSAWNKSSGISITESQISDFGTYLESETDPKRVSSAAFSGTSTKTLTLTMADASTVTAQFTDMVGEAGTGDDWGSQAVVTDATLTGDGTAGDVLKADTTLLSTITNVRSIVSDSIDGISADPAGSSGDIQYNNSGSFGGFGDFNGSRFSLDNGDWFQAVNSTQVYPYAKVTPAGIGWGDTDNSTVDIGLVYDDAQEIFKTVGGFQPDNIIDENLSIGQTGEVLKKTITGLEWDAETSMVYPTSSGIVTYNTATGWTASITNNSTNWNTAYGWGDHSTEGYLTQVDTTSTTIVDANWKTYITNHSTGGGEDLPSGVGILTTNNGSYGPVVSDSSMFWNTAYGWGDHSTEGYLTTVDISSNTNLSAGNNLTLTGDELSVDVIDTLSTSINRTNWLTFLDNNTSGGSGESLWTEDTNGITYTGSVGVDAASTTGYKLNVGGSIKATGDVDVAKVYASSSIESGHFVNVNYHTPSIRLTDTDNDKYTTISYQSSSNMFNIGRDGQSIFQAEPGEVRIGYMGDRTITDELFFNSSIQNVSEGSKSASFTHDAYAASIGSYNITTTNALTLSIHNLEVGMQGTIFLTVTDLPTTFTVNTYSDAGSTGLTEVVIGNDVDLVESKYSSITYTCSNDGTSTRVFLIYGQEQ
jgi:hypothetical protein